MSNTLVFFAAVACTVIGVILVQLFQFEIGGMLSGLGIALLGLQQCQKYKAEPTMRWWVRAAKALLVSGSWIFLSSLALEIEPLKEFVSTILGICAALAILFLFISFACAACHIMGYGNLPKGNASKKDDSSQ
jgi:hypothetical protein